MNQKKYYSHRFVKKYHLNFNFLRGFLFFTGIWDNSYESCLNSFINRTPEEALQEDIEQLKIDFANALERHKKEFPSLNNR